MTTKCWCTFSTSKLGHVLPMLNERCTYGWTSPSASTRIPGTPGDAPDLTAGVPPAQGSSVLGWGAWPGSNLPFASAALGQERCCANAVSALFAFPKPEMLWLDQALTRDPPTHLLQEPKHGQGTATTRERNSVKRPICKMPLTQSSTTESSFPSS